MGEVAEMMVEGEQCSWCGVCFEHPHGYPVACKSCWREGKKEFNMNDKQLFEQTGVQKAIHKELGEE